MQSGYAARTFYTGHLQPLTFATNAPTVVLLEPPTAAHSVAAEACPADRRKVRFICLVGSYLPR